MKRLGLTGVYEWGLLAILALMVVHAPLSVWLGTVFPDAETLLKAWKELLIGLLAVVAVLLVSRRRLWTELSKSWVIRLSVAFGTLHVVLAFVMGGELSSIAAGLMIDLRFVAMFVLVYIAVRLRPGFLQSVWRVVAVGAVVVLGFGLLQITVLPDGILRSIGYSSETIRPFTTIDSNTDYVRINSTLRGPNPVGAMTVIYGALALAYLIRRSYGRNMRRRWLALVTLAASVAVLFASYSRSAYLAFAATLAVVVASSLRLGRRTLLAGAGVIGVFAIALVLVSGTDWYSNVILHEDPESTVESKSNEEHAQSLATGAYRLATQPIGAGIGSTGSASMYDRDGSNDTIIENYYFFVAHEAGWLGLMLFVALFILIMLGLWRRRGHWLGLGLFASGLGLAAIGVLLPVWADETVALIWWGLAGAVLASTSGIIGHDEPRTRE
jgi:hypothetical protein